MSNKFLILFVPKKKNWKGTFIHVSSCCKISFIITCKKLLLIFLWVYVHKDYIRPIPFTIRLLSCIVGFYCVKECLDGLLAKRIMRIMLFCLLNILSLDKRFIPLHINLWKNVYHICVCVGVLLLTLKYVTDYSIFLRWLG